jgi:hypothetical protein
MTDTTLRSLAAAAHECWCDRMREQGWRYGPDFSADALAHDALRPFDQLPLPDQRRCLRILRCEETVASFAELLEYPRDEPGLPELQPEDMCVGRGVDLTEHMRAGGGAPAGPGRIISWTINTDSGDLDLVQVRWADGAETEHTPGERELTLLEETPGRANGSLKARRR